MNYDSAPSPFQRTIDGIIPQTPPHVAAFSPAPTFNGTVAIPTTNTNKVTSFDLSTFYLACVVGDMTNVAGLPDACTVRVNGVRRDGSVVAEQTFSFAFAAAQVERAPMELQRLQGFTGLKSANFQVVVGELPVNPVGFIDNVVHVNHY